MLDAFAITRPLLRLHPTGMQWDGRHFYGEPEWGRVQGAVDQGSCTRHEAFSFTVPAAPRHAPAAVVYRELNQYLLNMVCNPLA